MFGNRRSAVGVGLDLLEIGYRNRDFSFEFLILEVLSDVLVQPRTNLSVASIKINIGEEEGHA